MVRKAGLEPARLAALEPKSSASTSSATFAATMRRQPRPATRVTLPDQRRILLEIGSGDVLSACRQRKCGAITALIHICTCQPRQYSSGEINGTPAMEYAASTMQLLLRLADLAQLGNYFGIDAHSMYTKPGYASYVICLALASPEAEMKALGAMLRNGFFGPAGVFSSRSVTDNILYGTKARRGNFERSGVRAPIPHHICALAPG